MRVRYSARARAQIEIIHEYIAARNKVAATVVVAYIRQAADLLQDYPNLGRITDEKDVRILAVPRFPYSLFYTVREDTVVLLSVMHAKQDRQ